MWRIIFISLSVYILGVSTKPTEPLEGPLWLNQLIEPLDDSPILDPDSSTSITYSSNDGGGARLAEDDEDIGNFPSKILRQRRNLLRRNVFNSADDAAAEDFNLIVLRPPNDKRALSMFARWGSLGNLANERTPIRNALRLGDSKQTRARMAGQPLRWG